MREKVVQIVKEAIVESVGVRLDDIKLDSQLVNDLGADSLDLVELMYQLETRFNVSLERGAVLQRIKSKMPEDELLDKDGFLTKAGKKMIKREIPELANVDFPQGMTLNALVSYFTVEIFVNLILRILEEQPGLKGSGQ